jgi:hypothetical protein
VQTEEVLAGLIDDKEGDLISLLLRGVMVVLL